MAIEGPVRNAGDRRDLLDAGPGVAPVCEASKGGIKHRVLAAGPRHSCKYTFTYKG